MDNYQHDERPFVYDGDALLRYRKIAERWTEGQAARLDTTPDEILAAIRERVWLPEQIEAVTSRYALEDHPPLCAELRQGIERIRQAPIVAVRNAERRHRGSVDRVIRAA